jgi:hypothetical protein
MSFDYNEKARQWYERALKERDEFVKFILFYISLEVSIKQRFNKIRDLKTDGTFKSVFFKQVPEHNVGQLKAFLDEKPLKNENPDGDNRWSGKLVNTQDFDGVIEFVIRARNNLFHGDKGLDEKRDIFVVTWGNILLEPLVKAILK